MKGEIPFSTPCVVGHEITGEVVEHGPLTDTKIVQRCASPNLSNLPKYCSFMCFSNNIISYDHASTTHKHSCILSFLFLWFPGFQLDLKLLELLSCLVEIVPSVPR